jgi:hypothetical protein
MHAEGEGGGDPEIPATTTAQSPEEIGMLVLTHAHLVALAVDQIDGEEVVAGEAVLTRKEANATAQGQPAMPIPDRFHPGR